jgi:hypothetical protein
MLQYKHKITKQATELKFYFNSYFFYSVEKQNLGEDGGNKLLLKFCISQPYYICLRTSVNHDVITKVKIMVSL